VASNGNVYVADCYNHRVQYFTSSGSFLGKFGSRGTGNGEFRYPWDVALSPSETRLYAAEGDNCRVQYFRRSDPTVVPESLGKVKALFR
jgi:DNA-binding beta-propeller fold protein YncE